MKITHIETGKIYDSDHLPSHFVIGSDEGLIAVTIDNRVLFLYSRWTLSFSYVDTIDITNDFVIGGI